MVKYTYDAWGNNEVSNANNVIITDANHIGNLNPFRYRGYYYDTETKLYFLKTRYYDPEIGRFITIDGIEYLDPESVNGLNLYAYCGNDPVNRIDPNGNKWWHWILGALAVVAVTALTAGIAGLVATKIGAVLGVGTLLVKTTVIGSVIGGLVTGGLELISQGIATNWQTLDFWALTIDTFTGSLYGAASGMMGTTTSVGLRLATRATIVATSGLNAALHAIKKGKSFGEIMLDVGISMGAGLVLQGAMLGLDARAGKLSKTILGSYAIDGYTFMLRHKLLVGGISALKNMWRNRENWFNFAFN